MKALMDVALRVLLRVAKAWCSCGAAVRCVMRLAAAAGMMVRRRLHVPKHCRLHDGLSCL
jgi:hypothetical protein